MIAFKDPLRNAETSIIVIFFCSASWICTVATLESQLRRWDRVNCGTPRVSRATSARNSWWIWSTFTIRRTVSCTVADTMPNCCGHDAPHVTRSVVELTQTENIITNRWGAWKKTFSSKSVLLIYCQSIILRVFVSFKLSLVFADISFPFLGNSTPQTPPPPHHSKVHPFGTILQHLSSGRIGIILWCIYLYGYQYDNIHCRPIELETFLKALYGSNIFWFWGGARRKKNTLSNLEHLQTDQLQTLVDLCPNVPDYLKCHGRIFSRCLG